MPIGSWAVAGFGGLLSTALIGCATHRAPSPQVLAGTFSGHTEDGQTVVVTFSEDAHAFEGAGTVGGEPIVVAGAAGWRGAATVSGSGSPSLAQLALSADGETLVVENAEGPRWVLERGGTPAAPPAGAFTGSYRAQRDGARIADVRLVQRGPLLSGVARVAGDPAGVGGRVTGAASAEGLVTFFDGS